MTYLIGTDWSHWNGDANIKTAVANGLIFFFFKATQGYALKDDLFDSYKKQAEEEKVIWGPYHFFMANLDPIAQAKFFHDTVGSYTGLPPVVDFELTYGMSKSVVNDRLWKFCKEVERLFGVAPIIYTRGYFWNYWIYRDTKWRQFPLWVANYETTSPYIPADWTFWTFWQFTAKADGGRYGVSSASVDLNNTSLSYQELAEMANAEVPTPPPPAGTGYFEAYVYSTNGLRVRNKPSGSGTILRVLAYGEKVKVYGTEYDSVYGYSWGKISDINEEWTALKWVTMSL